MKPRLKKGKIQRGFDPEPPKDDVEGGLLDKVERELHKEGIDLFSNEGVMEDYIILPPDITEETSRDLGRYFNAFTKQKMWTRTLLGRVGAVLRETSEELDFIRDKVYGELPPKMSVKEKELKLRSHEKYGEKSCELLEQVALLDEKKKILKDYLENLVDAIFNISREISRRESDWNESKREDNIEKKRRR